MFSQCLSLYIIQPSGGLRHVDEGCFADGGCFANEDLEER